MGEVAVIKPEIPLELIEGKMLEYPQVDCPVKHNFADGVYVRELFIPKGTLIMGKRHRFESCNILLKGKLAMHVSRNSPAEIIEAPFIFNSKPGVKKFALALEDTIFLNIHPTDEKDIDNIEQMFIISEEEFKQLDNLEIKKLEEG